MVEEIKDINGSKRLEINPIKSWTEVNPAAGFSYQN